MTKKLIFMDLDGTIIDHSNNSIPNSTKVAIAELKKNGHEVVIATGRPPVLFYNIDRTLGIDTFIAANGRFVQYKKDILLHDYIEPELVDRFVSDMKRRNIDVAFESKDDYVVNQMTTPLAEKFSQYFHLEVPDIVEDFHKNNHVLQMVMFYDKADFEKISKHYPELDFNISCPYGVDINAKGGMKEIGVEILCKAMGYPIEDTIAIGDGFNDIGMIEKVHIGIAMGNACEPLKKAADIVTDTVTEDGVYKIMKALKLI